MAWSYKQAASATPAAVASGNLTLNAPDYQGGANAPAAGDLYVAWIAYRDSAPFVLPVDWALAAPQQSSGNVIVNTTASIASLLVAYIIRGASEPSRVFTRTGGDVAQGNIVRYRPGAGETIVYDTGASATLAVAGTTNTVASGITVAQNGSLLIAVSACARAPVSLNTVFDAATGATTASNANTYQVTEPANNAWTNRFAQGTTIGADQTSDIADAVMVTAGPTGAITCTVGQSGRHAMAVAAFMLTTVPGKPTHTMNYNFARVA